MKFFFQFCILLYGIAAFGADSHWWDAINRSLNYAVEGIAKARISELPELYNLTRGIDEKRIKYFAYHTGRSPYLAARIVRLESGFFRQPNLSAQKSDQKNSTFL